MLFLVTDCVVPAVMQHTYSFYGMIKKSDTREMTKRENMILLKKDYYLNKSI